MVWRRWCAALATMGAIIALVGSARAVVTPSAVQRHGGVTHPQSVGSSADWSGYLHDPGHSSYNPAATSIGTGNIGRLRPVWRWRVPTPPNGASSTLWASPVVSNGVVYIGVEDGYFYAINEANLRVLWSRYLGYRPQLTCPPMGITSTAEIAADPSTGKSTIYINAPDGHAYALLAATGSVVWKSVVAIPSSTQSNYYAWGTPLVSNGAVYVGISSHCDQPLVPGGVVAFKQTTGAQIARWLDQPATKLGGSVWDSPSPTTSGRIIVGTGNGYSTSGQPLYDNSIVALDPSKLTVLDDWQTPAAGQILDGDWGGSPTMFTADIKSVSTPMVGMCNKNGVYYAFRQDDLHSGPVWQTQVAAPYTSGSEECVAAAIWDGTRLIEGGGAPTTIGGTSYTGSVQALDPATGVPIWQTGLPGAVVGSPTEDGAGIVAAATFQAASGATNGVYLLNVATGAILDFIPTPQSDLFGQPIFSGQDLLVGAGSAEGLTAYEITTPGAAISSVAPGVIGDGTTDTVTLTGSGFSGTPNVMVSGDGVFNAGLVSVSSTQLKLKLSVLPHASQTVRDITVAMPGSPVTTDTCTACLTIGPKPSPPTISSITPSSFAHGAKSVPATIAGTNFDAGAVVTSHAGLTFNVTFVNSSQLNVSVSVKSTLAPGSYNLIVTNGSGMVARCTGCITVT